MTVGGTNEAQVAWGKYESKTESPVAKPHEVKLGWLFKSTEGVGTLTVGHNKALVFDTSKMNVIDKVKFSIGAAIGWIKVKQIEVTLEGKKQTMFVSEPSLQKAGGIQKFGANVHFTSSAQTQKITASADLLKTATSQLGGDPTRIANLNASKGSETLTLSPQQLQTAFEGASSASISNSTPPAPPSRPNTPMPTQSQVKPGSKDDSWKSAEKKAEPKRASEMHSTSSSGKVSGSLEEVKRQLKNAQDELNKAADARMQQHNVKSGAALRTSASSVELLQQQVTSASPAAAQTAERAFAHLAQAENAVRQEVPAAQQQPVLQVVHHAEKAVEKAAEHIASAPAAAAQAQAASAQKMNLKDVGSLEGTNAKERFQDLLDGVNFDVKKITQAEAKRVLRMVVDISDKDETVLEGKIRDIAQGIDDKEMLKKLIDKARLNSKRCGLQ